MAYLAQDDKQQDQNQQNQAQGQTTGVSGPATVGGGAPVSSAGVSGGGVGGFANIQAYLAANQGTGNTGQIVQDQVGGQFDQEKQNLNEQAQQTKDQAKQAVDQNNIGQDQASKLIQDAGKNYTYNGPQNQAYTQIQNQLQQGVSGTYSGPKTFSYGVSGKTQQYGADLNNDQGFKGLMANAENEATGGRMGSGQLALQNQLDTADSRVNDARNALLARYSGLTGDIDKTSADTNTALGDYQNQYATNEQSLSNYLSGLGGTNKKAVDDAMAAQNAEEARIKNETGSDRYADTTTAKLPTGAFLTRYLGNGQSAQSYDPFTNGWINDRTNFLSYKGDNATEENAAGVKDQRNQFNAVMDALGKSGDKINQADQEHQKGHYEFDDAKVRDFYNKLYNGAWDYSGTY